jgi:hypothetical protein
MATQSLGYAKDGELHQVVSQEDKEDALAIAQFLLLRKEAVMNVTSSSRKLEVGA